MAPSPPCGERLQGYGRRVLLDQPRKRFLDFFWLFAPPFNASSTWNKKKKRQMLPGDEAWRLCYITKKVSCARTLPLW